MQKTRGIRGAYQTILHMNLTLGCAGPRVKPMRAGDLMSTAGRARAGAHSDYLSCSGRNTLVPRAGAPIRQRLGLLVLVIVGVIQALASATG